MEKEKNSSWSQVAVALAARPRNEALDGHLGAYLHFTHRSCVFVNTNVRGSCSGH